MLHASRLGNWPMSGSPPCSPVWGFTTLVVRHPAAGGRRLLAVAAVLASEKIEDLQRLFAGEVIAGAAQGVFELALQVFR
jgi:hypothetical protein